MTRQILIVALASFGLTQLTSSATSIYLHRALAHHSLSLRPALALAFRTIVWKLTGQSQQQWVAVHRGGRSSIPRGSRFACWLPCVWSTWWDH